MRVIAISQFFYSRFIYTCNMQRPYFLMMQPLWISFIIFDAFLFTQFTKYVFSSHEKRIYHILIRITLIKKWLSSFTKLFRQRYLFLRNLIFCNGCLYIVFQNLFASLPLYCKVKITLSGYEFVISHVFSIQVACVMRKQSNT